MDRRLQLQTILENLLGTRNVYFQPPNNVRLSYPCIIYKRDMVNTEFADNNPYSITKRYMVTVIDRDPDSNIPDKVGALKSSRFVRHFTSDDLNHDIYNLYF